MTAVGHHTYVSPWYNYVGAYLDGRKATAVKMAESMETSMERLER